MAQSLTVAFHCQQWRSNSPYRLHRNWTQYLGVGVPRRQRFNAKTCLPRVQCRVRQVGTRRNFRREPTSTVAGDEWLLTQEHRFHLASGCWLIDIPRFPRIPRLPYLPKHPIRSSRKLTHAHTRTVSISLTNISHESNLRFSQSISRCVCRRSCKSEWKLIKLNYRWVIFCREKIAFLFRAFKLSFIVIFRRRSCGKCHTNNSLWWLLLWCEL